MCLNLVKGLDRSKYDIHIAALGGGELLGEFESYTSVKVYSRKRILNFIKDCNKANYSIIHSHTIIADLFSSMIWRKAIKLTTIHNYPDIDSIYRRGRVVGGGLYLLQKIAIRNVIKVACSISVERYCTSKLHMARVISIPNGVPSSMYSCNNSHAKEKDVNFYYLGSITERKNVEELVAAFSEWCANKKATLSIIGDGNLLQNLSSKYNNSKITYYGKISNPGEIVNQLDCFVSSSKAEGMPLALLEALSLGKPYICSNIDPHLEVYKNDGGNAGFIYELGNKDSLIKSFEDYFSNQQKNILSQNAKKCFDLHYNMGIMSDRYDVLYSEENKKFLYN